MIDEALHIVGIDTLADFMRTAELDVYEGFDDKLRQLVRSTRSVYSGRPKVVGQIMTRKVHVTELQRHLVDLQPLSGSTGRRPGQVMLSPVQGQWPLPGWLAFFR